MAALPGLLWETSNLLPATSRSTTQYKRSTRSFPPRNQSSSASFPAKWNTTSQQHKHFIPLHGRVHVHAHQRSSDGIVYGKQLAPEPQTTILIPLPPSMPIQTSPSTPAGFSILKARTGIFGCKIPRCMHHFSHPSSIQH